MAGKSYGAFLNPKTFGKNGGHSTFPHLGGKGAGRLYLKVSHTLTADGELLAKGGKWRSVEAGGGSGGAILMNVYTLDGSGTIDASGGDGYGGGWSWSDGGGGGGGLIALYYKYNFFVGKLLHIFIPPANCVCGWVYCFHVVRPSDRVCVCVRVSVTFCFLNNFKNL